MNIYLWERAGKNGRKSGHSGMTYAVDDVYLCPGQQSTCLGLAGQGPLRLRSFIARYPGPDQLRYAAIPFAPQTLRLGCLPTSDITYIGTRTAVMTLLSASSAGSGYAIQGTLRFGSVGGPE